MLIDASFKTPPAVFQVVTTTMASTGFNTMWRGRAKNFENRLNEFVIETDMREASAPMDDISVSPGVERGNETC